MASTPLSPPPSRAIPTTTSTTKASATRFLLMTPPCGLGFSGAVTDPLLAHHVATKLRFFKNSSAKPVKGVASTAQKSVEEVTAADIKGKKVFVRANLDVGLDDNQNITDDTRVRAAVPTIKQLINSGAKVILSTHLGRPPGLTPKLTLAPLVSRLSELLGIQVVKAYDCIGPEVQKLVSSLPDGGVLLLENIRSYKEEEKNELEFAKKLASLADLYVNDAFGTANRAHASTEEVTKLLKPSIADIPLQKEVDYLVGPVSKSTRPFAAIVGGSRVSSKIGVIESLMEKCDVLLLGGGMIFTFYKAQGLSVGPSLVEEEELDLAISLLEKAKAKGVSLLLPTDVLQGRSKIHALPKRTSTHGKKKRYGGILPSILRSLAEENDVEKTLGAYYGKLTPKEQTIILREQSSWEKVLRIFEGFKSQKEYVPNVIHYNVVLRALGRAQKWDELRLYWIEMAKMEILPSNNTYGMLVDVYGKGGLVKESLMWIKHMMLRGIFPDEVTMNTVVRVLKDAGEYSKAVKFYKDWCNGRVELADLDSDITQESKPYSLKQCLLTELFRTGGRNNFFTQGISDVERSVRKPRLTATYNTLIDLYGKAGHLKDASDAFADMLKSGVTPDTITFNTMIFICGSHGHLSEAEALLNKMEEWGISPDTKTYNILLSLYGDMGNIDAVLLCYKKIKEVGLFPDEVTHRAVLQILCNREMVQEVAAVIEEIEASGKHIDQNSLPILVNMYVNQGLAERAMFLFEKCQSTSPLSSGTCAAIIDVYADKGLWAEAEAIFYSKRSSFEQKRDVLEYNVMIKAYGKAKLYEKAVLLFKGMKTHGTWPDECTYNTLIQMLAGGDLVDKARDFLVEMRKAGLRPSCSTYSAIIACYVHMKRLSDAVDMFQEMLQADVRPNDVVYGAVIDGFAEAGKFEEAIHYFHVMEESGVSANQIVLTSMIKAYGKIGSVEGAKQVYEKIKKLNGGPDIVASNSMLNLYAELGMVTEAKVIYDDLKEKILADGVTFATMMYVYKNMGMLDEAIEVAEEMKQSHLLRDCVTFNKVMACYVTNGQLVECGELLHEMVINRKLLPDGGTFKVLFTVLKKGGAPAEAVRQLEISYQEGRPYARQAVVTSVFSVVGLHAYALESCEIFKKTDFNFDAFAYNAAIRAYGASGKTEEALNVFMRMQDEGLEPDVVTFIYLVGCYGKAGMTEGVKRIYSQLKYGAIEPSESLYNAVIDAYRVANRHDLVELVHQEKRFASHEQEFMDCESTNDTDLLVNHI